MPTLRGGVAPNQKQGKDQGRQHIRQEAVSLSRSYLRAYEFRRVRKRRASFRKPGPALGCDAPPMAPDASD